VLRPAAALILAGLAACGPAPQARFPAAPPSPTPAPTVRLIGTLNPAVTQATIHGTVCVPGWTARIRPPAAWTTALKKRQLPAGTDPKAWEEDHVMPLGLGGAPKDPANLRPVPIARAKADDVWETRLHRQVCAGTLTLTDAQAKISAIKDDD
jgi:hypothetical protein